MNLNLQSISALGASIGRPYPARDWALVALVALAVAVLGIGLAAFLFWGTQTGTIIAASQDVPRAPIPVSREAIKKVLELYETRATNYAGRNFIIVNLTDPRPKKR